MLLQHVQSLLFMLIFPKNQEISTKTRGFWWISYHFGIFSWKLNFYYGLFWDFFQKGTLMIKIVFKGIDFWPYNFKDKYWKGISFISLCWYWWVNYGYLCCFSTKICCCHKMLLHGLSLAPVLNQSCSNSKIRHHLLFCRTRARQRPCSSILWQQHILDEKQHK